MPSRSGMEHVCYCWKLCTRSGSERSQRAVGKKKRYALESHGSTGENKKCT